MLSEGIERDQGAQNGLIWIFESMILTLFKLL